MTPTISAEGNAVMLKISVESSSLVSSHDQDARGPGPTSGASATNVLIENGGVVVLGGLIQDTAEPRQQRRAAASAEIPLLGKLFKARNDSATSNNLMIFIQPTILRDQSRPPMRPHANYNYMLRQQNSVIPEQFPQLLRGEPAPRAATAAAAAAARHAVGSPSPLAAPERTAEARGQDHTGPRAARQRRQTEPAARRRKPAEPARTRTARAAGRPPNGGQP